MATMAGNVYINNIQPLDTITISDLHSYNWVAPEEWKTAFPDWDRMQDMCSKYPGLQIAFEKFKTVYKLVKDDYDNPKDDQ